MEKRFLIIEGPAGSGKSTLTSGLKKLGYKEATGIIPIITPRAYETSDSGASLSMLKDHNRVISILANPDEGPWLLDRFYLSQLVYHQIRSHLDAWPHVRNIPMQIEDTLTDLALEYCRRLRLPDLFHVTWGLVILMPPLEQLEAQRKQTPGRIYPYPAERELAHYDLIGRTLGGNEEVFWKIKSFVSWTPQIVAERFYGELF